MPYTVVITGWHDVDGESRPVTVHCWDVAALRRLADTFEEVEKHGGFYAVRDSDLAETAAS